jgi:aromatic-L-amino-acid/L-tryptophan decarboxylase
MGLADSIVLDPHKGLFQPYGIGAVLVRDAAGLKQSMGFEPDYMRDISGAAVRSPADYSPELTRHFRAARLWFALKIHGLGRYRAALEEKLRLAEYAYEALGKVKELTLGPPPHLSVVTFRAESDEKTEKIHAALLQRGRVHLSSTRLGGMVYLRLCVLSFRSHLEEIDEALSEIRLAVRL